MRIPVVLPPDRIAAWLNLKTPVNDLQALLAPVPADAMRSHPVSERVNNPRYGEPDCIAPLATE
jgi:putative SOS response-associated peptidase YedK